MKYAVIDSGNLVWGYGQTEDEAYHDAYRWANQDHEYEDYEAFFMSKFYDSLKILQVTDDAYALLCKLGGFNLSYEPQHGIMIDSIDEILKTADEAGYDENEDNEPSEEDVTLSRATLDLLDVVGNAHETQDETIRRIASEYPRLRSIEVEFFALLNKYNALLQERDENGQ